jgi:hypothetical protein
MRKCANCGKELTERALFCGNCGANVEWERLPHFRRVRSLTKVAWLDTLLGMLVVIIPLFGAGYWNNSVHFQGSALVFLLPIVIGIVAHRFLRDTYPDFAKGIKAGLYALAMLAGLMVVWLLGALVLCAAIGGFYH